MSLQAKMDKQDHKAAEYYLDVMAFSTDKFMQEAHWEVDAAFKIYKEDLEFEKQAEQKKKHQSKIELAQKKYKQLCFHYQIHCI